MSIDITSNASRRTPDTCILHLAAHILPVVCLLTCAYRSLINLGLFCICDKRHGFNSSNYVYLTQPIREEREMKFGVNLNNEFADAVLGDGMTGVQTLGFEDGTSGIVICRDGKQSYPFEINENGTTYLSDEQKVFVRASSKKSIQVLIDRLKEAKSMLD
ncbi:TMhelix containing protein [Vibrio phage 1.198.B._10N.286.54.F4]|nr:TMhelix containing protein [Vibrio phage 1.198.A._10N.286.54.F4]AUR94835.1 TMhelix containing protein [Vibrio phage 1.198.B._10N.286.54.F4]